MFTKTWRKKVKKKKEKNPKRFKPLFSQYCSPKEPVSGAVGHQEMSFLTVQ